MVRVFSTQFPLNSEANLEKLLGVGRKWIAYSPHSPFREEELNSIKNHGNRITKDQYSLEFGKVKNGISSLIGLRYASPDGNYDLWTTSVVGLTEKENNWVSIAVDYDSTKAGGKIPTPKKPYLIQLLLKEIGGGFDGDIKVSDNPINLKEGDEPFVAEIINGEKPTIMPIVYLSRYDNDSLSLVSKSLAKELSGIAHVFVEPSRRPFSFNLRDYCKGKNIFGGAVGIYWPEGFGRTLWLPEEMKLEKDPFNAVYSKLVEGLKSRMLKKNLTWEDLQSIHNSELIEKLRKSTEEKINSLMKEKEIVGGTYAEQIKQLGEEMQILEEMGIQQGQKFEDDKNKYEERIFRLENELRKASANRCFEGGIVECPQVNQVYPDEIKTIVFESLQNSFKSSPNERTRRRFILEEVVKLNQGDASVKDERVKKIHSLFKGYDGMTAPLKKELQKMGFEIRDEGRHYKLYLAGNEGGLCVPISKTPGTKNRGDKNTISDIINTFF